MLNCEADQLTKRAWDDLERVATPEFIRSAMGIDADPPQCAKLGLAGMACIAGDLGETGDVSGLRPGTAKMLGVLAMVGICRMMEERMEVEAMETEQ